MDIPGKDDDVDDGDDDNVTPGVGWTSLVKMLMMVMVRVMMMIAQEAGCLWETVLDVVDLNYYHIFLLKCQHLCWCPDHCLSIMPRRRYVIYIFCNYRRTWTRIPRYFVSHREAWMVVQFAMDVMNARPKFKL